MIATNFHVDSAEALAEQNALKQTVVRQLSEIINKNSLENLSDTPDFILGEFLWQCLRAYNETAKGKEKFFSGNLTASEALYGFIGWLMARKESVIFGAMHDASKAAELVKVFCQTNHLDYPRENWHEYLLHPNL